MNSVSSELTSLLHQTGATSSKGASEEVKHSPVITEAVRGEPTANKKRPAEEGNCSAPSMQSSQPSGKRSRLEGMSAKSTTTKPVKPSNVGLTSYEVNDVLSGRGGGTNQHEGNCFFRSLINKNREKYLRAKKNSKPHISMAIVKAVRERNGRFLRKDDDSNLWFEIGDAAAREKTSQALRQRAPEYRRLLIEKDAANTLNEVNNVVAGVVPAQPQLQQQLPLQVQVQQPIVLPALGSYLNPQQQMLLGSHFHFPQVPSFNNEVLYQDAVNSTILQMQLQEAQRTMQLQERLDSLRLFEMMLKNNNQSRPPLGIRRNGDLL